MPEELQSSAQVAHLKIPSASRLVQTSTVTVITCGSTRAAARHSSPDIGRLARVFVSLTLGITAALRSGTRLQRSAAGATGRKLSAQPWSSGCAMVLHG